MSQDHTASLQPLRHQSIANGALSLLVDGKSTLPLSHGSEGIYGAAEALCSTIEQATDATNAVLSMPSIHTTTPSQPPDGNNSLEASCGTLLQQPDGDPSVGQQSLMALPVATPRALPPLLRYVDHNLMQNVSAHNRPPHPNATCPVCFLQWDSSPMVTVAAASSLRTTPKATSVITSTFLPLSPCRHWVHYSCLIWLATRTTSDHKDRCPVCHIQLFEWEGITALTLATRTDLELQDQQKDGFFHPISHVYTPSDRTAYETECTLIDSLIAHFFFAQLNQPSRFVDLSPDLLRVYYDVLSDLDRMKKPAAKWLSWTTQTGFLLLGMLIAIKMRRFLLEGHKGIVSTESWKEFDEGVKALQKRIMDEVHQP